MVSLGRYCFRNVTKNVITMYLKRIYYVNFYLFLAFIFQGQLTSATATPAASSAGGFVAPISSASPAFTRSQLTHGIRQVSHCVSWQKKARKKCSDRKMTTWFCRKREIVMLSEITYL